MSLALVIDDDTQVRELICVILKRAGFEVLSAKDGREGLATCKANHPDVVVTDIFMPHQDGIDVLREIKSMATPPRVVVISGGSPRMQLDFLEIAQKLGADFVLHKPFTRDQLIEAVTTEEARRA
ncbi:MAG TPA: response regulator [Alphaproteobacteria bacterium]|nr:response regulator [Alphaproteobacteria bacterium]